MWTVPGYVGGEPEQPVPRDVVATCCRRAAREAPLPHWSVDFWISDVDEAAAKVPELGGKVLAALRRAEHRPRQGAFSDPQGATFSLTQPPGV